MSEREQLIEEVRENWRVYQLGSAFQNSPWMEALDSYWTAVFALQRYLLTGGQQDLVR